MKIKPALAQINTRLGVADTEPQRQCQRQVGENR